MINVKVSRTVALCQYDIVGVGDESQVVLMMTGVKSEHTSVSEYDEWRRLMNQLYSRDIPKQLEPISDMLRYDRMRDWTRKYRKEVWLNQRQYRMMMKPLCRKRPDFCKDISTTDAADKFGKKRLGRKRMVCSMRTAKEAGRPRM